MSVAGHGGTVGDAGQGRVLGSCGNSLWGSDPPPVGPAEAGAARVTWPQDQRQVEWQGDVGISSVARARPHVVEGRPPLCRGDPLMGGLGGSQLPCVEGFLVVRMARLVLNMICQRLLIRTTSHGNLRMRAALL